MRAEAETATYEKWATEVRRLAVERNAVILAHNYQVPWIQDVADFVGDSLALSRQAAETDSSTIVFCGVHFMAETAKILSPEKTVLLPDLEAGCSLAASITADQLRAWKAEHPGAVVVSYVNTTAEVKAESHICCTSSNAVDVVSSIPEGQEILFLPDMFLGAHIERQTGRKMHLWMGECHVHAGIDPQSLKERSADPDVEVLIHPECGCTTTALWLLSEGVLPKDRTKVLSTGGMVQEAGKANAKRSFKLPRARPKRSVWSMKPPRNISSATPSSSNSSRSPRPPSRTTASSSSRTSPGSSTSSAWPRPLTRRPEPAPPAPARERNRR